MAAAPQFANVINSATVQASVANTNRDGATGTYYDIVTGGVNGTRVDKVVFKAAGTTVAGMVRIFIWNGTSARLIDEVLVTAITASGTVAAWQYYYTPPGGYLTLPATWVLRFAINDATNPINAYAVGGDF